MKQSKNVDWDQYLEEVQRLTEQQSGKPWQELLNDADEQKKERAYQALNQKDTKKNMNWSHSSEQEIMTQIPQTAGATVKEFYVRIFHWQSSYTFSIYQVIKGMHKHVMATTDERFKGQPWLKYFEAGTQGFDAETAADIILFLQDIQELLLLV